MYIFMQIIIYFIYLLNFLERIYWIGIEDEGYLFSIYFFISKENCKCIGNYYIFFLGKSRFYIVYENNLN